MNIKINFNGDQKNLEKLLLEILVQKLLKNDEWIIRGE